MGRPKGSKNKVKTEERGIQNTEMYLPGGLGSVGFSNGDTREIKQVYKKNDGSVTITIGAKEPAPYVMTPELEGAIENAMAETSPPIKIEGYHYPSNWDTMGKIDRLKWLKSH